MKRVIRIRVKEDIDRRYLGALCVVDSVTKGIVRRSLDIRAKGLRLVINRSYLHIIVSAEGLENHLHSFVAPPGQPEIRSKIFQLTISDPLRHYLPRIKRIELPRNPDPKVDDGLFEPIRIPMFSAASGSSRSNWSIIRASVYDAGQEDPEIPIRGALLRIVREEDEKLLAVGLADPRGEAMIIVPGIPIHSFITEDERPGDEDETDNDGRPASGDVVEKETSVKLYIVVDKKLPWPVDPELLEENSQEWLCKVKDNRSNELVDYVKLKLKTGQTRKITLFVKVPHGR
jgi:hypothetical protein